MNDLHLTDSKLRCRLTDGLERCRITDENPPTLKKKSQCRTCDRAVSKIRQYGRRIFGRNVVVTPYYF